MRPEQLRTGGGEDPPPYTRLVTWAEVITLAIALGGLILGVLAELRHRSASRPRLRMELHPYVTRAEGIGRGVDVKYVGMVVTNVGREPVAVETIALGGSDGRSIQLEPVSRGPLSDFPAVLALGDSRLRWIERAELADLLERNEIELVEMRALLLDGTVRRVPVQPVDRRIRADRTGPISAVE